MSDVPLQIKTPQDVVVLRRGDHLHFPVRAVASSAIAGSVYGLWWNGELDADGNKVMVLDGVSETVSVRERHVQSQAPRGGHVRHASDRLFVGRAARLGDHKVHFHAQGAATKTVTVRVIPR